MIQRTEIHRLTLSLIALFWAAPILAQDGARNGEWPAYAADGGSTKYSTLSQVDRDNVGSLEIAWRWQAENFGPEPEFNYRVTPIMVDGVLFVTIRHWLTPKGVQIDQVGIRPDVEVTPGLFDPLYDPSADVQIFSALDHLLGLEASAQPIPSAAQ